MFSLIVDKEISLKLLTISDSKEFYHLTQKNLKYLSQYMPRILENTSLEFTNTVIRNFSIQYIENKGFKVGVVCRNKLIGLIGFKYLDFKNEKAEIMYWISQSYSGKGVISKCVKKLTEIGFNEYRMNKIVIKTSIDNIPSKRVAEKCGFSLEAIHREDEKLLDGYTDICVYTLFQKKE